MSHDWEIKEGDSLPELDVQIRDPSGDVADLSSVQDVEFRMAHVRSDTLVASASASITDGATGRVQYNIGTSETGREGLHHVEWRVTRSSGETYSYPQGDNQTLFINAGVGRDLETAATTNGTYQIGSLDAESVDAERVDIAPLKIGYLTDTHWGNESQSAFKSTNSELKSKLDEFAADMNSWGADLVIWGGDMTGEVSDQAGTEQFITDFRNHAESQLDCPTHLCWGNHEYANPSTWGYQWAYDEWGISTDDETYYSIDNHHAKTIVLNTGFNDGSLGNLESTAPPGQYEWLESELESTDKPVLIWTHTPPQPDPAMHGYNSIEPVPQSKYTRLFSDYDNIVGVFFGHNHWAGQKANSIFHKSVVQEYDNVPYIYQHYPFSIGPINGNEDHSVTPYAKVHVYQDGHVWIQQSYDGEGTGYRSNFRYNGDGGGQQPELLDVLEWESPKSPLESLNAYRTTAGGTDGSVALDQSGDQDYLKLVSASDGTASSAEFRKQPRALLYDEIDWPDMMWYAMVEFPSISSNHTAWMLRGTVGPAPHIGFKLDGDTIFAHVHDGSSGDSMGLGAYDSSKHLLRVAYSAESGVARFGVAGAEGIGQTPQKFTTVTPNINQTAASPSVDPFRLFNVQVSSKDAAAREMRVYDWGLSLHGPGALNLPD